MFAYRFTINTVDSGLLVRQLSGTAIQNITHFIKMNSSVYIE